MLVLKSFATPIVWVLVLLVLGLVLTRQTGGERKASSCGWAGSCCSWAWCSGRFEPQAGGEPAHLPAGIPIPVAPPELG